MLQGIRRLQSSADSITSIDDCLYVAMFRIRDIYIYNVFYVGNGEMMKVWEDSWVGK